MMEHRVKRRPLTVRVARIFVKSLLIAVLVVLVLALIVEIPPVQNLFRSRAVAWLEKKLGTRVKVGYVHVSLPGNRVLLKNVYIEDQKKDTLLSGSRLEAHINFFDLLFNNDLDVSRLELENVTIYARRMAPDTVFNYQFFINAFSPKTPRTSKDTTSFYLGIPVVKLQDVRIAYYDDMNGSDLDATISHLEARVNRYDPARQIIDLPSIEVNGMQARLYQLKKLATPEPMSEEIAEAARPNYLQLLFDEVGLRNVNIEYRNDVSAIQSNLDISSARIRPERIDLAGGVIELDSFRLHNSSVAFRFGKKEAARAVQREISQEIESRAVAGWALRVKELDLKDNVLSFDDENKPRTSRGMDYAHLLADSLTLRASDLVFQKDSISGTISEARFREHGGFVLNELRTKFLYSDTAIFVRDLYLRTPGTELKRYASLNFSSLEQLSGDFPSVMLEADIDDSYVQVRDILNFAPALSREAAFSQPDDTWHIDLQGRGTLKTLYIANLQFDGLKNTTIDAEGSLAVAQAERSGGRLVIHRLHTTQSDIALFTRKRLSTDRIDFPEEFNVAGTIAGGLQQLSADLDINSSAGSISIDGTFSNLGSPHNAGYNAFVTTTSLQLGRILRNAKLGSVSGEVTVSGKGLKAGSFDTRFRGVAHSIGFSGYNYRNARLEGTLNGSRYSVTTRVRDPNLAMHGTAKGSFSTRAGFAFHGFVDSIKTMPLRFTNKPLVFRGKIDAELTRMTSEYIEGEVLITQALFVTTGQRLPLDSIRISAGGTDSARFIELESDVAYARLWGDYRVTDLSPIFIGSLYPHFPVPASRVITHPYDIRFTASVSYAPVLTAFIPGLKTFESITAEGSISPASGLQAQVSTPYVHYMAHEVSGLELNLRPAPGGGIEFIADASRVRSGTTFDLHHTQFRGFALNGNMEFSLLMDDAQGRRKYNIAALLERPRNGIYVFHLRPDSLVLNYDRWSVNNGNSIRISNREITAHNLVLRKGNEELSVETVARQLQLRFSNFHIATITGFFRSDSLLLNGAMNGTIVFRDITRNPVFTSDLRIFDLSMRGDTLGNAVIRVDHLSGRYQTNATLNGRGNDVAIRGWLSPSGEKDVALDLHLDVRSLQLNTIEGALANVLQNASGSVRGTVSIGGSVRNPQISGPLRFDNASFALRILGSQFRVDGEQLQVTEEGFLFRDFLVRDSANNTMLLNGYVRTPNFVNYEFDLDVNTENFRVLQTTRQKAAIYWGDLVITSEIHIGGTDVRPRVDGTITVNEGTNLTFLVPQRNEATLHREGIVEFTDLDHPENDSLFRYYDALNAAGIRGFDITTNIEVRKEAIFNIIIDAANGDFINMQGEAQISTGIDPSGKITMVGNYELDRGAYEITFNFLRRRFEIQKGSRIVWLNEPTSADLDVRAIYVANTAPIDLVQNQIASANTAIRNTYLQKLPFEVHLQLTGRLMQPRVAFDILLPPNRNYGVSNDIITQVESRLGELRQDPGEINKQVFALLLLGRFVGENPFATSTPGFDAAAYARQSVSRLLTGELNRLAAGLIDGVDLSFDVTTTDDYTTGERRRRTDLDVSLSRRLLNERLTVSVGSNFELEGPKHSAQKSSNLLGNVAVNYALSRDGRYMIRFYRKNEYQGVVDGYVLESGLSFLITVDYDRFSEVLRSRRQRVKPDTRDSNPE